MKPLILIGLVIGVFAALVAIANYEAANPDGQHLVPHPEGPMLAVSFAHADHVDQSCIECHHNYVDDTGAGMCFDCHKTDPEVNELIEEQFHDLCRNCHIEKQLAGEEHGPTRQCNACHIPDTKP
ncbi:MAG: hypothetical protein GKR90_15520 [Pseudomonadales bacterium]|nr:hypothetical protein [Pseudomonadales bacterium]